MKIGIIAFSLIFMLMLTFVISQEVAEADIQSAEEEANVGNILNADSLPDREDINKPLGTQIKLPEKVEEFLKDLWGEEKYGQLTLQVFIIILVLFLIISAIVESTVSFLGQKPLFNWIFGALVSLIVFVTGAYVDLALFFMNLGNIFNFLTKWPILATIFTIFIIAILGIGLMILLRIIKDKKEIGEGHSMGITLARLIGMAKTTEEYSKI